MVTGSHQVLRSLSFVKAQKTRGRILALKVLTVSLGRKTIPSKEWVNETRQEWPRTEYTCDRKLRKRRAQCGRRWCGHHWGHRTPRTVPNKEIWWMGWWMPVLCQKKTQVTTNCYLGTPKQRNPAPIWSPWCKMMLRWSRNKIWRQI